MVWVKLYYTQIHIRTHGHAYTLHIVQKAQLNSRGNVFVLNDTDKIYYIRFVDMVMMVNYTIYFLDIPFSQALNDDSEKKSIMHEIKFLRDARFTPSLLTRHKESVAFLLRNGHCV